MRRSIEKTKNTKRSNEMFHVKHSIEYTKVLDFISVFINNEKTQRLFDYFNLLVDYNQRINLYSRNSDGYALVHFLDSICASLKMHEVGDIIDVGSGNGMPGIVYSIIYPESKVVLCERSEKKCFFLKTAVQKLNLKNVSILNKGFENDFSDENFTVIMKGINPSQMKKNISLYTEKGKVIYFSASALKTKNVYSKYFVPVYSRTNYLISIDNNIIEDRCLWEK